MLRRPLIPFIAKTIHRREVRPIFLGYTVYIQIDISIKQCVLDLSSLKWWILIPADSTHSYLLEVTVWVFSKGEEDEGAESHHRLDKAELEGSLLAEPQEAYGVGLASQTTGTAKPTGGTTGEKVQKRMAILHFLCYHFDEVNFC